MPKPSKLSADRMVDAGIHLLEALSAAPDHILDRQEASRIIGVAPDQLPEVIDTLETLADRTSGARAVIEMAETHVRVQGNAALLQPLRLSVEESMIVEHMLDMLHLDDSTKARIRHGIMGDGDRGERSDDIAETSRYGTWLTRIREAIDDGIRCELTYRSRTDDTARTRTIDPIRVDEERGVSYLIAWDVERDEERRYRLDRIHDLSFTDDSVVPHTVSMEKTADSLRRTGSVAHLRAADESTMQRIDWAGVGRIAPQHDGSYLFDVHYSSSSWLYDQVLAAGGELTIVEPAELRAGLAPYASILLEQPAVTRA
ncbi:WYL domain-containing protein [Collinsella tanakaei]|uniref:WYL domain-containing protein n=1 Tax=Collinsella tanakaei TaxID=626935 RepID=UPI0025A3D5A8|nr:WYL domain-containing protein [Collinsella tanakaei]MDM8302308.1 WYL domain-containing protein [Collinsella tanakaei]